VSDIKAYEKSVAYEPPVVRDFGDLVELTQASGFTGAEDGGSKQLIHHDAPPISVGLFP